MKQEFQEEEKRPAELKEGLGLRLRQQVEPSGLFEGFEFGSSAEEKGQEGSGIGVPPAGVPSHREIGSGRCHRGGVRGSWAEGTTPEAAYVLPTPLAPTPGSEIEGQQRACNVVKEFGPPKGGSSLGASRRPSRKAYSRRRGDTSRLEHGQALGSAGRRGRHQRTPAYPTECATTCKAGRKSGWQGLLAKAARLARRRLGRRVPPQRKRKGPEGQEQERKRKGQRTERRLEQLGSRPQRQGRRQSRKRRRGEQLEGVPAGPLGSLDGPFGDNEVSTGDITWDSAGAFEDTVLRNLEELIAENSTEQGFQQECTDVLHCSEPGTKAEWLNGLTECSDLAELGIRLAWGWRAGWILVHSCAKPTRTLPLRRGSLFPLPVSIPEGLRWDVTGMNPCEGLELAVSCWAMLGCAATNKQYGVTSAETYRSQSHLKLFPSQILLQS